MSCDVLLIPNSKHSECQNGVTAPDPIRGAPGSIRRIRGAGGSSVPSFRENGSGVLQNVSSPKGNQHRSR